MRAAFEGLEAGPTEVLVDDDTRASQALLVESAEGMYPDLAPTRRE